MRKAEWHHEWWPWWSESLEVEICKDMQCGDGDCEGWIVHEWDEKKRRKKQNNDCAKLEIWRRKRWFHCLLVQQILAWLMPDNSWQARVKTERIKGYATVENQGNLGRLKPAPE